MSVPGIAPEMAQAFAANPLTLPPGPLKVPGLENASVLGQQLGHAAAQSMVPNPAQAAPAMAAGAVSGAIGAGALPLPAPVQGQPAQAPVPVTTPSPKPVAGGLGGGRPAPVQGMDDLERGFAQAAQGEKAALTQKQDAIVAGTEAESKAIADQAQLRQIQADELAAKQAENARISARLDAEDERNLEIAKSKTIPSFWEGKTGARLGAFISVALTGAGSALLGSTSNAAMEMIKHKVDQHIQVERQKIDDLFRFAQAKGQLNAQSRQNYARQLLDLKDQHTYLLEAARDRVTQVAAESKGAADAAQVEFLKAGLDKQIIQDRIAVRKLRSELETAKAQQASAYANAAESRAGAKLKLTQAANEAAGLGKTGKIDGEALKSQGFADTAQANHQIITSTPISAKGVETIMKDLQYEAMGEQSKGLRAGLQAVGLWKTIEQKLSPSDQKAFLAMRQFINADLRRESGAAIGAQEFASAASRYFPQVGDSPETIRQKQLNREQSIHSMRVAGRQELGGNPVTSTAGSSAGPAPAQAPQQLPRQMTVQGRVYTLGPDGQYH